MKPWFAIGNFFGASRKSPGQKSEVRTHALEMELDHDSGRMEGRCLRGQFSGRALSSLSDEELLRLLEELRPTDSQGAFLIKVYFDRRSRDRRRASSNSPDAPAASPICCCGLPAIHFRPPPRHAHAIVAFKGTLSGITQVAGQKSEVRTHALEMELDHDSGRMEGRCLKGQFSGRALSSLSDDELLRLLEELRPTDYKVRFCSRAISTDAPATGVKGIRNAPQKSSRSGLADRVVVCPLKRPMMCSASGRVRAMRNSRYASKADDEATPRSGGIELSRRPHQ